MVCPSKSSCIGKRFISWKAGASFNSGNKPEITSNDGNIPKIENENKPDIDYDNETEIDDKAQAEIRHYEFTVNVGC